jgi:hypothetical protein
MADFDHNCFLVNVSSPAPPLGCLSARRMRHAHTTPKRARYSEIAPIST